MSKHPGTSGLMPVKGSTCGIRPDLDAMSEDTGFDFSQAQALLQPASASTDANAKEVSTVNTTEAQSPEALSQTDQLQTPPIKNSD